jgi:hypothetical protein
MRRLVSVVVVALMVVGLVGVVHAEDKAKPAAKAKPDAKAKTEGKEGLDIEVKFAKTVESRQPVDPSNAAEAGKLYCWNLVKGGDGDFKIFHVWYREGKKVRRQGLQVKGKKWITWSFHNVTPGAWKVEITDAGGSVLQTADFTVK